MAGECEQNPYFWCPLQSSDCASGKLKKPCSILYSATHAKEALAKQNISYEIQEGTMKLKTLGNLRP